MKSIFQSILTFISGVRAGFISGNPKLLILLSILSLVMIFYPLLKCFYPADDYAIYIHFAEAASDGQNPYSLPEEYRSTVPPTFFTVGWTQPEPGMIRQVYADHSPLLILFNSWIFRLHQLKGLYRWYILLYAVTCILYCIYAYGKRGKHRHNPLIFFIFLALNPLITTYWFKPIEDKIWFIFLLLLSLLLRNKPFLMTLVLALFASLKGLGLFVFAFYLAYLFFNKIVKLKYLIGMGFLFAILFALSHIFWFPDCLNAYKWRAERWSFTTHDSVFVPLDMAGLFWKGLPKILIVGTYLLMAYATVKRWLTLQEVILLPVALYIVFNTDLSFDRLLIAILALLLLAERNLPIILAYFAGVLIITPVLRYTPFLGSSHANWIVIWSLTVYLLVMVVRQIVKRNKSMLQTVRNHTPK